MGKKVENLFAKINYEYQVCRTLKNKIEPDYNDEMDEFRYRTEMLRKLQEGQILEMPHSRPMPVIGERCHELRVVDVDKTRRIIYRIDSDVIVILDVFSRKTRTTPQSVIDRSRKRLREYDDA